MKIKNRPGLVYEPREDSYFLLSYVEEYALGSKVLDMGTGTGIQAIKAYKSGAEEVVAVDINTEAIKLAKENAKRNDCEVKTVYSDLFEEVEGKFDLIIFNPPYLPKDYDFKDDKISKAISGGDSGSELIIRFLDEVKSYLTEEGIILLELSSRTGKEKVLEELENQRLNYELLGIKKLFFEELYILKIG